MGTSAGLAQLGVHIKGRGRGTQKPPESPGERPGQEGLGIMTLESGGGGMVGVLVRVLGREGVNPLHKAYF